MIESAVNEESIWRFAGTVLRTRGSIYECIAAPLAVFVLGTQSCRRFGHIYLAGYERKPGRCRESHVCVLPLAFGRARVRLRELFFGRRVAI
jgi:hypothetical protein